MSATPSLIVTRVRIVFDTANLILVSCTQISGLGRYSRFDPGCGRVNAVLLLRGFDTRRCLTENSMECPNCGLFNPPTSERCDCGFDFTSKTMEGSLLSREELKRASADPYPVPFIGVFRLLILPLKWLHGMITGDVRRRRQLKSACERGDGIEPDNR